MIHKGGEGGLKAIHSLFQNQSRTLKYSPDLIPVGTQHLLS